MLLSWKGCGIEALEQLTSCVRYFVCVWWWISFFYFLYGVSLSLILLPKHLLCTKKCCSNIDEVYIYILYVMKIYTFRSIKFNTHQIRDSWFCRKYDTLWKEFMYVGYSEIHLDCLQYFNPKYWSVLYFHSFSDFHAYFYSRIHHRLNPPNSLRWI